MQQVSAEIPKEIEQLASVHRLGTPQTVHAAAGISPLYRSLGPLCLAIGGFIIIAYLFAYDTVFAAWPWWQAVFIPLVGVAWVCVGGWIVLSPFLYSRQRVFVFSQGLISLARRAEVVRWDQIEGVWKDVSVRDDGTVTGRVYIVLRGDGETFLFKYDLSDIEKLGARLEDEVTTRLLPRVLAAFDSGVPIDFSELTIGPRGIRVREGRKAIAWDEVSNIGIDETTVSIYKRDETLDWATIKVADVPNIRVLELLIEYVGKQQEHSRLPRVIALYEAGLPVFFSQLSVSRRGIDLYEGEKHIPWEEIGGIGVGSSEVIIKPKRDVQEWHAIPLWLVPDAPLLKELVDYIMTKEIN